jgi:hypothetical protein
MHTMIHERSGPAVFFGWLLPDHDLVASQHRRFGVTATYEISVVD